MKELNELKLSGNPLAEVYELSLSENGKNPGNHLIPIVLNFCDWDRYFGNYTALPYTTKPVVDLRNEDMALFLCIKAVRILLMNEITGDKLEIDKQVRKLYERIVEGKVDDNSM